MLAFIGGWVVGALCVAMFMTTAAALHTREDDDDEDAGEDPAP